MINKVTLIGNLGSDPEIKELSNGVKLARVGLATNERYQDSAGEWKDITEWHNVLFWRKSAESAERVLKKGMQIYVEGKIKYRKWQDDQGNDKYATDIEARGFRILGKRENSTFTKSPMPEEAPPQVNAQSAQEPAPQIQKATADSPPADDLPF